MSLMMPDPLGVDVTIGTGFDPAGGGTGNPILGSDVLSQAPEVQDVPSLDTRAVGGGTTGPTQTGSVSSTRQGVVDFAKQFLGDPYVWGGTKPGGFDCSGILQYVLSKKGGIQLPRISAAQANFGQRVNYDGLQAGDLVAWDNSSRNNGADHIALYIGNGYILEAPHAGAVVRIRYIGKDLDGGWGVHLKYSGESSSRKMI
jgi:cell wall-associated NlpC family hydrolase